jgi:hypothetical protein
MERLDGIPIDVVLYCFDAMSSSTLPLTHNDQAYEADHNNYLTIQAINSNPTSIFHAPYIQLKAV